MSNKENIVLVGMPGAGKSTVGVVLAKKCGYRFLDSDLVIQEKKGKLLHELITEHGVDGFLAIEDEINASIETKHSVIATGGSAVYGRNAMKHLKDIGSVIYLQLSYEEIAGRLGNLEQRGVTLREVQTLLDLYQERVPLYEKYADFTISCNGKELRNIVDEICEKVIISPDKSK